MKSPIIDRKEDCWVSILADILWSIHSETINIQYHTHIYTYVNSDIKVGYICFNLLNWGFRLSLRSPPFWFHFKLTYEFIRVCSSSLCIVDCPILAQSPVTVSSQCLSSAQLWNCVAWEQFCHKEESSKIIGEVCGINIFIMLTDILSRYVQCIHGE